MWMGQYVSPEVEDYDKYLNSLDYYEGYVCPVCGADCVYTLYKAEDGSIIGCNHCIRLVSLEEEVFD